MLCCQSPHGLLAAAAVIAEADALVSTPANGPELCQAIRGTLDGRQALPMTRPRWAAMMRELFDGEEQAVLAMMLAGIPRGGIASTLGVSSSGLNLLLWEMLRKLRTGR